MSYKLQVFAEKLKLVYPALYKLRFRLKQSQSIPTGGIASKQNGATNFNVSLGVGVSFCIAQDSVYCTRQFGTGQALTESALFPQKERKSYGVSSLGSSTSKNLGFPYLLFGLLVYSGFVDPPLPSVSATSSICQTNAISPRWPCTSLPLSTLSLR